MRLGLGLGVNSITSQKIGAGFTGILDEYSGAAAAYSVRRLSSTYTDGLIRVRRSSDDAEQDIGFDANGDLDTTALTTFVNEDVNQYTSDFSSTEDLNESNGTGAAAQSVGGVDDAYKFTLSGGSATHFPEKVSLFQTNALSYSISFDYYIPSGNASCDGIKLNFITGAPNLTTQNSWTSVELTDVQSSTSGLRFYASDGGSISVNGDGDVFYLKNIVITQTTADGAVTTFYDQSGNGNNATNSTATQQPLIVSGGSIIYEGATISRPAISGNNKILNVSSATLQNTFDIFSICNIDTECYIADMRSGDVNGNMILGRRSTGWLFNGSSWLGNGSSVSTATQILANFEISTTSATYHENGSSVETISHSVNTSTNEGFKIDFLSGHTLKVQELIFFNSDQSTNRTGIESNINDHFDIYTP